MTVLGLSIAREQSREPSRALLTEAPYTGVLDSAHEQCSEHSSVSRPGTPQSPSVRTGHDAPVVRTIKLAPQTGNDRRVLKRVDPHSQLDRDMAGVKGRSYRRRGSNAVEVKVRVEPEHATALQDMATAAGISMAAFVDRWLAQQIQDLDERGVPRWWDGPVPADQGQLPVDDVEELPLKTA